MNQSKSIGFARTVKQESGSGKISNLTGDTMIYLCLRMGWTVAVINEKMYSVMDNQYLQYNMKLQMRKRTLFHVTTISGGAIYLVVFADSSKC